MTTATGKFYPVGARYASVFALDSAGYPLAVAPAATPYSGFQFKGAKAFSVTIPAARTIVQPGDDRVQAVDQLPSLEAATGVLNVSRYDMAVNAFLTGVKTYTVAEATAMSWWTNQQGNEPDVALFLYQQGVQGSNRVRNWRSFIIPSARISVSPGGFADTPQDVVYNVVINPVAAQLWGTALSVSANGATEHGVIEIHTEKRPFMAFFLADGTEDEFLFATNKQAYSTAKVATWNNGAPVTTGLTVATTGLTFTTPPTATHIISAFYELAADATSDL